MVNSTEWKITVHLDEFDESWMRYSLGRGSDKIILNTHFPSCHIYFAETSVELL